MRIDSFQENILGVQDLVESGINKVQVVSGDGEGVSSQGEDVLDLPMSSEELLKLRDEYEGLYAPYIAKIKPRQDKNRLYYSGRQQNDGAQNDRVISSNLIFEAEETFIPQALSKNPEPVVWSDNTNEGKDASNDIKTMLQFHADQLNLRSKLGGMVRQWSVDFIGVLKHGWDDRKNEIKTELRRPQNFLLDPNGYVDEFGNFIGWLGERITDQAKNIADKYPKHEAYISEKVKEKMGTQITITEWWNDEYSFVTFQDVVLDKFKNPYFNYDNVEKNTEEDQIEFLLPPETVTPGKNHFAIPKKPYTFLSVFSLQEAPHDITNLIEQNISNQDRINDRDEQISKNLRAGNNSIVVSGVSFNIEEAEQAARAIEDGDPVLVPDGKVESAIKRLPANDIPSGIFTAQQNDMNNLRSIFGTQGLTAEADNRDTTARGMILNQSHDSSRIGGGIGDKLEQVADNVFNWWVQLYYVFYDEPHYGAIMGSGRAVEYVRIINSDINRRFVVSVSPNSMQPKDEITEQNIAIDLANKGWLDPINLFKKLNYPDPMETAKMVTMWKTNPQVYMAMFFPESQPQPIQQQGNPQDLGQIPQPVDESLGASPASASLSQVPISTNALPQ